MTEEEKQEYLANAKAIKATTLGTKEALRKLNEVADAINACLFEKFPDLETGMAALVMDKLVSNMIERAMQIASGMGQGKN